MFTKTTIALAAALIAGSASAVLASDHEDQHWDSAKEMLRLESLQAARPLAPTLAGHTYALAISTRKHASLRANARAN